MPSRDGQPLPEAPYTRLWGQKNVSKIYLRGAWVKCIPSLGQAGKDANEQGGPDGKQQGVMGL